MTESATTESEKTGPTKTSRGLDGSAGDADYGAIGPGYSRYRQPDPHVSAAILAALGGARTLLNVGAGTGSYEPADLKVTAVEPSASMRAQRPLSLSAAIDASAEELPFPNGAFDAALASFTIHQWTDLQAGRPEALLDPGARRANFAWSIDGKDVASRFEIHLRKGLESGAWDARFSPPRSFPLFNGSLRLIVGRP